ncbi:hypothetical protein LINGRAHAP2_LOCUS15619, partial [Linum grandiflorum]
MCSWSLKNFQFHNINSRGLFYAASMLIKNNRNRSKNCREFLQLVIR